MENKKQKFERLFNQYMNDGAEYIAVFIKAHNLEEPEMIVNPKENLQKKLEYYLNAYNDDMRLNSLHSIQIVAISPCVYLEDLYDNKIEL